MQSNSQITIQEISENIGITIRSVEKQIATLKKKGSIDRVGADKTGSWIILSNNIK